MYKVATHIFIKKNEANIFKKKAEKSYLTKKASNKILRVDSFFHGVCMSSVVDIILFLQSPPKYFKLLKIHTLSREKNKFFPTNMLE